MQIFYGLQRLSRIKALFPRINAYLPIYIPGFFARFVPETCQEIFDLLPGDQISPDDPCQWLLIRREMPVPDPTTGLNLWNIDFLFADQNGMPTFVECKRFNDTDSRRKVVGQMLEYAANGHYYWTTAELAPFADQSANGRDSSIEEKLKRISWHNPGRKLERRSRPACILPRRSTL